MWRDLSLLLTQNSGYGVGDALGSGVVNPHLGSLGNAPKHHWCVRMCTAAKLNELVCSRMLSEEVYP